MEVVRSGVGGCYFLHDGVSRLRGLASPPLGVGLFSWFLIHLRLAMLAFYLKKKKMEAIAFQATH